MDVLMNGKMKFLYIKEEEKLAKELRKSCFFNGKEKDIGNSAKLLHKMGLVYQKRSEDKISLVQSAILFNAAIVRNPDNVLKIKRDLHQLCSQVLRMAKAKNRNFQLVDFAHQMKHKLTAFRTNTAQQLSALKLIPDGARGYKLRHLEDQKLVKIQQLQTNVTTNYISILNEIAEFCENALGRAPCDFALVAMGNVARNEITPYSEFEFMVALRKGIQQNPNFPKMIDYFGWFTAVLKVVLVNLGETLITNGAIPTLNNFNNPDATWLSDRFTPEGISFEGLVSKPCVSSLDRPLIEMLKFLDCSNNVSAIVNRYAVTEKVTKACFVYGDKNTFENYVKSIWDKLSLKTLKTPDKELAVQIKNDFKLIGALKSLGSLKIKDCCFDARFLVHHSPHVLIYALGRIHEIKSCSTVEVVNELAKNGFICEKYARQLKYMISIACELRLKICLEDKYRVREYDVKSPTDEDILQLLRVVGKTSLTDFFWIAWSLCHDIINYLSSETAFSFKISHAYFSQYGFLVHARTLFYLRLYRECIQNVQLRVHKCCGKHRLCYMYLLACSYEHLGQYVTAQKQFQEIVVLMERKSVNVDTNDMAFLLMEYGKCYMALDSHQEAVSLFTRALELYRSSKPIDHKRTAECSLFLSECFLRVNRCSEVMKLLKREDPDFQNAICQNKKFVVKVHNILGNCLKFMREDKMAIGELQSAVDLSKKYSEDERNDPCVAESINNIGKCYSQMSRWEEAWSFLQENVGIEKRVVLFHPYTKHTHVADWLSGIGSCLMELKRNEVALKHLKLSVTLRKQSPDEMNVSSAVVLDMNRIALIYRDQGKNEDAFRMFENTLAVEMKSPEGNDHTKNMINRCREMGLSMKAQGHWEEALAKFENEYELLKKLPKCNKRELDIAECLHYTSMCLDSAGRKKEAMLKGEKSFAVLNKKSKNLDLVAKDVLQYATYLKYAHKYRKALTVYKRGLVRLRSSWHCIDFEMATTTKLILSGMGECLLKQRRHHEALKLFNESLALSMAVTTNAGVDMIIFALYEGIKVCHRRLDNSVKLSPFTPIINHDDFANDA